MFMLYFIYRPENPHHMEMFDQRVNASIQIEKEQQTKQKLLFSKFFVVFSCESFREGNERKKTEPKKYVYSFNTSVLCPTLFLLFYAIH